MNQTRWLEIWNLYRRACEAPEGERAQLLEQVADPEVRGEVAGLLEQLQDPDLEAALWPEPDPGPVAANDSAAPEWPHLGQTFGRFTVTAALGRGSSGVVYAGRDNTLGRSVALKFSALASLGSSQAVKRSVREARAASALNHPNLVTLYDILPHETTIIIVMELVAGRPLQARCGAAQPAAVVADWGRQIAGALAAAHAAGIMHRDIKPENLMLRPDGLVKVLDFGLARAVAGDSLRTQGGLLTGTLRYMSPEQTRAETAAPASDIFSLGIVLYELVAGVHPFAADSPLSTAHFIATRQPAPPSRANPALGAEWDALLLAMLHKNPAQRPAAPAVAERLERLSAPSSVARRARPALGRWALAALLLALVPGGVWWRLSRRPSPASSVALLPPWPVSRMSGNEGEPAFSPDGGQLAFTSDNGSAANRDIYVRTLSSAGVRRLTFDDADHFDPAWAPDGSRIAFLRSAKGAGLQIVTVPVSAADSLPPLQVVGELQGQPLANVPRLTWAPDGRSLVIAEGPPGAYGDLSLYRLDLQDGARRPLTTATAGQSDVEPQFSPDGRQLAYLRTTPGQSCALYLLDAAALAGRGQPRRLVASDVPIDSFQWTPGGRALIYGSGAGIPKHIWTIAVHGGTPQPAALPLPSPPRQLAVARRGGWVAFLRPVTNAKIWRFDIHGRLLGELPTAPREDQNPRYSPDGTHIVYASRRTGPSELWISDPDGSNPWQLTHQEGDASFPEWSPDGMHIAYQSLARGLVYLWVMSAAGGEPVHLGQEGEGGAMPSWSRDAHFVYFCSNISGRNEIWKRDVDNINPPIQVTFHGGLEGKETFDGRYFYFIKNYDLLGLWRKPVEGDNREKPEDEPAPGLAEAKFRYWEMARDGVYYIAPGPPPTLKFYRFATAETTVLAHLDFTPPRAFMGFAVAPDGQAFLLLHIDAKRTEIDLARPAW